MTMCCRIVLSLSVVSTLYASSDTFAQEGPAVPVICYHGFSEERSAGQGKLTESYERFGEMLRFLNDEGYRTMFPEELVQDQAGAEKAIVMTFDDGRKDQVRAAEVMHTYGMRGIFFVVPSRISGDSSKYLTGQDLALLTRWGHQIGVHGFAHESMVESSDETESVRTLALKTVREAVPSQSEFPNFAFPFGHYDTSGSTLAPRHFRFLHTVNPGYWDRRSVLLPRMLVTTDKSAEFFMAYVKNSRHFRPLLETMTPDGGSGAVVSFRITGMVTSDNLSVMAVSADKDDYHYSTHTAADFVSIDGDVLRFSLRNYLGSFFRPTRIVLSYVFLADEDSAFVSSGVSHWIPRHE